MPLNLPFRNWNPVENRRRARLAMTVSVLAGLLVLFTGVGEIFRGISYDLPHVFSRTLQPDEVVIVKMDDRAHKVLGQRMYRPWSRDLHAKLLRFLKESKARLVVFDVFLADVGTTDQEKEEDEHFASALKEFGNVVLAAVPRPESREDFVLPSGYGPNDPIQPAEKFVTAVGEHWGTAAVYREKDGEVMRRHWPDRDLGQQPALPWVAAALYGMKLKPEERSEPRWLRYYGPDKTLRSVSYADYDKMPPEFYAGKVVFVGGEPDTPYIAGKADVFETPFTLWTGKRCAGVEIVATTFLNLIRGEWLSEMSPIPDFLMVICAGLIFGFLFAQFEPNRGALVAVACLLLVAACGILSFWLLRYWFDWSVIAGVQIPAAYATSAIVYSRKLREQTEFLTQEKQRIEKELETIKSRDRTPHPAAPPIRAAAALAGIERGPQLNQDLQIRDFELLRCIGEGAYGEVWLARTITDEYRAIKIIFRNKFSEQRPFEREFEGVRTFVPISLTNPGWVGILHVGKDETRGLFYYVMELADDMTSGDKVDPNNYTPKTLGKMLVEKPWLPVADCLAIGIELADALGALHKLGLVHRDVKPSNVIFGKGHAKLADIGLVANVEGPKTFAGTEGFIPPEGPGTPLADIFSLGRTLYQAASGCEPKRQPGLPTALGERDDQREFIRLIDIIDKACASFHGNRYQTAEDLRKDLVKLQTSLQGRRGKI
jgi:CHASE2 domain-containing sensor protein